MNVCYFHHSFHKKEQKEDVWKKCVKCDKLSETMRDGFVGLFDLGFNEYLFCKGYTHAIDFLIGNKDVIVSDECLI